MKHWVFIEALIYAILLWAASSAYAQESLGSSPGPARAEIEATKETVRQLVAEIKTLKYELKTLQVEQQRMKVVLLERELAEVIAKRQRLERQENTMSQEIAQLEQHIDQVTLAPEEREELETSRSELMGGELERVRQQKQVVVQREAQVTQLLAREQEGLQELSQSARAAWNELQSFTSNMRGKNNGQ